MNMVYGSTVSCEFRFWMVSDFKHQVLVLVIETKHLQVAVLVELCVRKARVRLLGAMSDLPASAVLEGNEMFTNFKGAMAEQYVLQELTANGFEPCYWTNDAGNAEVEFVIQGERGVFPVEVKARINTQAKSLKVFRKLFSPPFSFRTSLAVARDGAEVKDVPLYAFGPAVGKLVNMG